MWSLWSDYPPGVGYDNDVDTWFEYGRINSWIQIRVLQGFIHNDAIQINGVTSTLANQQKIQNGTVMPGGK